jgi:hypothetical protein
VVRNLERRHVAKLVFERVVKAFVRRQRPSGSVSHDVHPCGDVSVSGEGFVSRYVLVAAIAAAINLIPGPRPRAVS